jgi:hypothetical protein
MMPLGRCKIQGNDSPWPMHISDWSLMYYTGYKQVMISLTRTYDMVYIKSWIPGSKDPIMKVPLVSGVSSVDITLPSATNLV